MAFSPATKSCPGQGFKHVKKKKISPFQEAIINDQRPSKPFTWGKKEKGQISR